MSPIPIDPLGNSSPFRTRAAECRQDDSGPLNADAPEASEEEEQRYSNPQYQWHLECVRAVQDQPIEFQNG